MYGTRYPTYPSLLNEAAEYSERIIDVLHAKTDRTKMPRTYREKARKDYLAIAKQKRPAAKVLAPWRQAALQDLRRNPG